MSNAMIISGERTQKESVLVTTWVKDKMDGSQTRCAWKGGKEQGRSMRAKKNKKHARSIDIAGANMAAELLVYLQD